jgi:maltooligosyltrehalose synthase
LRRLEGRTALVIVPRLVATLLNQADGPPLGSEVWEDTHILLPSCSCSKSYRNAFTGDVADQSKTGAESKLDISTAFAEFPTALYFFQSGAGQ